MEYLGVKEKDQRAYRLSSIDMVRGLIIVIMALDHVRDFVMAGAFQDPMNDPHVTPFLFFTRWITHFCAPVFVFFAGTSAGLMTDRKKPAELARFLVTRGLWLLIVEILIISTAITFSTFNFLFPDGQTLIIMQTLSAIGVSMIVLAAIQFLGTRTSLVLGILIVIGHNLLDGIWPHPGAFGPDAPVWVALHSAAGLTFGRVHVAFFYPFLPWIGVMLLGFGSVDIFRLPAAERDATLFKIGITMIAVFIALRGFDSYGDARKWHVSEDGAVYTLMSFLNVSKYPPSLLYVLMTIGPAIVLCSKADQLNGWFKNVLIVYGRVPFAFYVAHFYLAHFAGIAIRMCQGLTWDEALGGRQFGVSVGGVYLVWIAVVVALYPFCRWIAGLKSRRTDWWLSYL